MSFNESFGLKVRFLLQALIYKGYVCAHWEWWPSYGKEGNTGSIPVYSTMQKELGIGANSLGRTAIRLFEESTSK